jgi:hypothetical protein
MTLRSEMRVPEENDVPKRSYLERWHYTCTGEEFRQKAKGSYNRVSQDS